MVRLSIVLSSTLTCVTFKDLAGWWLDSKKNLMTGNLMSHQVNRYQNEENLSALIQNEKNS